MYMLPVRTLAPDIDLVVWNWTAWAWTAKEILTWGTAMEKMCLKTCGAISSVWQQTKDLAPGTVPLCVPASDAAHCPRLRLAAGSDQPQNHTLRQYAQTVAALVAATMSEAETMGRTAARSQRGCSAHSLNAGDRVGNS